MAPDDPTGGLAERIHRGDPAAEETLVEVYYGRIFALAVCRTRDREIARDLTQEIMVAVLCALRGGRLNDPSALTSYVYAAARHRIAYYFRHRVPEASSPPEDLPDLRLPDPEESFQSEERRRLVLEAIRRLRASERKILRLTLVEGLNPREVAERLNLNPEVVRKRKSRAIRRLQQAVGRGRSQS